MADKGILDDRTLKFFSSKIYTDAAVYISLNMVDVKSQVLRHQEDLADSYVCSPTVSSF